ncbi:MAG: class II fructose-bisphosphate aldolase [Planctomycetota bacterium]|jgi:fructose-bisphosphate aldolase class II|nr:class II fructose-bisphosphate aldolase [Planctomycetota bacterium]
MALIGMKDMLAQAYQSGYAVGGFDAFEAVSVLALLEEAGARRSPALMICAPLEYEALGAKGVVAVARSLSDLTGVDACLHLDHSKTYADVEEAIRAGFTSVMIDGSQLSLAENIALTRRVVDFAHPRGVPVEAELGAVGRVDESTHEGGDTNGNVFTDPAQAVEFVEKTGCDFLAVSIGNTHGLYRSAPSLQFDILAAIRRVVSIPLVLHGGSGTPVDQLKQALSLGIAKVNVASEIGQAFTTAYLKAVEKKTWWAVAKAEAKTAMRQVIGRWMTTLGSVDRL